MKNQTICHRRCVKQRKLDVFFMSDKNWCFDITSDNKILKQSDIFNIFHWVTPELYIISSLHFGFFLFMIQSFLLLKLGLVFSRETEYSYANAIGRIFNQRIIFTIIYGAKQWINFIFSRVRTIFFFRTSLWNI